MQCVQDSQKNFVQTDEQLRKNIPSQGYGPSDQVLKNIERITNSTVTVEALQSFQILSGIGESDIEGLGLARGHWCSMPAPDTPDDQDVFPKAEIEAYWKECVMPKAGYLNVLVCNNETSNVTGNYEAYLGLMATDKDVCYPLHAHVATEVYWQVGGQAVWRTWTDCSNNTAQKQDFEKQKPNIWPHPPPNGSCLVSGPLESWESAHNFSSESNSSAWHQKNAAGEWMYKDGLSPHWHPSPVVHETDTTAAGTTHVLNFYLWAKSTKEENQYHTGLGYFDMHRVFETLDASYTNSTDDIKPDREDRARELIGTCATRERIPSIFHEAWQPDLQQWLSPLTNWTPPAVQCPARRLPPPPPLPPSFPDSWNVTEWESTRDAIIKSLEAVTFFPDGDDSGPGTLALTDSTVLKQMKGVPGCSQA